MIEELNHSGYIVIKRKCDLCSHKQDIKEGLDSEGESAIIECHYAYEYSDGFLFIHTYGNIPELSGTRVVLGSGFDGVNYLFFTSSEITDMWSDKHPKRIKVDYFVKNYKNNATISKAVFNFEELQYFCPSASVVIYDTEHNVTFLRESKEIKSFDVCIESVQCHVCFRLRTEGTVGFAKSQMTALTDIMISFPETSDLAFLSKLYSLVDMVFAFICNRRNTTCLSMELIGEYKGVTFQNWKPIERMIPFTCEIFFFDYYREEPENQEIIKNTWWLNGFFTHIDKLFDLVARDFSEKDEENGHGTISIESIHPSLKRRRKIDLQLSLQIASAFEFYVRKYLPNMIEEKEYHKEIKQILGQIQETSTGKKKELAKSLMNNVVREPALEDKVWKAYNGYDNWEPIKPCISEEWFKEGEIRMLANEMNQWRNDLAHSKRKYKPNANTIRAVRLIEHLNYAIVLRGLGYDDNEIKEILSHVLLHEKFEV